MKNFLVPIAITWVGLSLVIGLVIVLSPLKTLHGVGATGVIERTYYTEKPASADSDKLDASVNIKGTPGAINANTAATAATVKVK